MYVHIVGDCSENILVGFSFVLVVLGFSLDMYPEHSRPRLALGNYIKQGHGIVQRNMGYNVALAFLLSSPFHVLAWTCDAPLLGQQTGTTIAYRLLYRRL
jgi:hypothetical protein